MLLKSVLGSFRCSIYFNKLKICHRLDRSCKLRPSWFNSEVNPYDGMKDNQGRGFRIEYDDRNGAHINVYNKKVKGPHFKFDASKKTVNKLIKRFK